MSLIGGMTVKESTFRIMSAVLDNTLARQCNWLGRSRSKLGFSSLSLRTVISGLFFDICFDINCFPNWHIATTNVEKELM